MFFTSQFVKIKNKLLYSYDHYVTVLTPLPVHFAVTFFYFLRLLFFGSPYYTHTYILDIHSYTHTRATHTYSDTGLSGAHIHARTHAHTGMDITPNSLAKANGVFVCVCERVCVRVYLLSLSYPFFLLLL